MQNSFLRMIRPFVNGHELIRIGNHGDGGYLLPDDLLGINGCLSIGSGGEWSFEKGLFDNAFIASHILDLEEAKPSDLDKNHFFHAGLLGIKNSAEYITLEKFLSSNFRNPQDITLVILQILFSLWIANKEFDFVHNDLHGENILINKLNKEVEITYQLEGVTYSSQEVLLETIYVAHIIDYVYTQMTINEEDIINPSSEAKSKDSENEDFQDRRESRIRGSIEELGKISFIAGWKTVFIMNFKFSNVNLCF
jgi:hypothetical protein